MVLFIAEKPDLGKAIAEAIPASSRYDRSEQLIYTTFKGEDAIVSWCFGHLLALYEPQDYDEKYATWKLEDLPFYFDEWKHKVKAPSKNDKDKNSIKKRVDQIGDLLKKAGTVVHAGDIDDEGQLLVDELLNYHHYTGKVLRLNTSDVSKPGMQKALKAMEPNGKFLSNGYAAYGRQLSDQLFGLNLTRYYSLINGAHGALAVGRVKMPTLGLVVQRDLLIEGHKKSYYYGLAVNVNVADKTVLAHFVPDKNDSHLEDGKIVDKAYIEAVAAQLNGKQLSNIKITSDIAKEAPPLPFNLSKLYSYCANNWDMQPTKVRLITQSLREKHKAITYNRTNCQYLFESTFEEAKDTVPLIANKIGLSVDNFDTKIKSRCFNDKNVTEHTAIIPTQNEELDVSSMSVDERKVYEAIAKYYLAQFMPPCKKQVTKLECDAVNGGKITATSSVVIEKGYRALLGDKDMSEDEDEAARKDVVDDSKTALSDIPVGTYNGSVSKCTVEQKETKPPARYTQASLCADMSCIAKYVQNEAVKKLLLQKDSGKKDEKGSVGTPATRDLIVGQLITGNFLKEEKKGKKTYIVSTKLGREFYNSLPDSVRKVDVTAKWWCEQEQIRSGEITPEDMAKDVYKTIKRIIETGGGAMQNAGELTKGYVSEKIIGKCPKCGADVRETDKAFKCTNDGCKFAIWKQNKLFASIGYSKITSTMAECMLQKKRVTLTNCKSKAGKTYTATLLCDFSGDYVQFNFAKDDDAEVVGKCPLCGGDVIDKGSLYRCKNENCDVLIWKDLSSIGKKISAKQAAELLSKGRTSLTNCKSKKTGKTFSCDYVIDFHEKPIKPKLDFQKK